MRLYWKLLLEGQTLAMVLHHWLAAHVGGGDRGGGVEPSEHGEISPAERPSESPAAAWRTSKWAARIALAGDAIAIARRNRLADVAARGDGKIRFWATIGFRRCYSACRS